MSKFYVKQLPDETVGTESLLKHTTSRKLRSGFVSLEIGKSIDPHSTENFEEMIVVLSGFGELVNEDDKEDKIALEERSIAYVPPHTLHYIRNTGSDYLQYVYIVTAVE